MPDKLQDEPSNPQDGLKKINLGIDGEEKSTFISANLDTESEAALLSLLKEYRDVFAWSYGDMPGLSSKLITHKLATNHTIKPVKQAAGNFSPQI